MPSICRPVRWDPNWPLPPTLPNTEGSAALADWKMHWVFCREALAPEYRRGEPEVTGQRMRINASLARLSGRRLPGHVLHSKHEALSGVFCNPVAAIVYKKRSDFCESNLTRTSCLDVIPEPCVWHNKSHGGGSWLGHNGTKRDLPGLAALSERCSRSPQSSAPAWPSRSVGRRR